METILWAQKIKQGAKNCFMLCIKLHILVGWMLNIFDSRRTDFKIEVLKFFKKNLLYEVFFSPRTKS